MTALLVVLAWIAALVASCAAIALHGARHGARGLGRSLLCPLGAALMYGFVSAAAGLGEGVWTLRSSGLWTALAIGASGAALAALGWRAVLRRPIGPGQCRACGYDIAGLAVCPECGEDR